MSVIRWLIHSRKKSFDWQFVSREKADHEIKWVNILWAFTSHLSLHEITGTLRKQPQKQM